MLWQDSLFFISLYFIRPLTVLIHELGHAIPLVLLTKNRATVFVGSYGKREDSMRIKLPKMEIFLRYNPFGWNKGVCIPSSGEIPINIQIIYTAGGALISLLVAGVAFGISTTYPGYSYPGFFIVLFLFSAIYDVFHNLIPSDNPIQLDDGTQTYNDGKQLRDLFRYGKIKGELKQAFTFYEAKEYRKAAELLRNNLPQGKSQPLITKVAVFCILRAGPIEHDLEFLKRLHASNTMDIDDLSNTGTCFAMVKRNEEAMIFLRQALANDPGHLYANANIAYVLYNEGKYEEALKVFTLVTEINDQFSYGFSNRGIVKIEMGDEAGGLADIRKAMELDPDDSFSYRSMGIYHLKKNEFDAALEMFKKAKQLYARTDGIDELIRQAETHEVNLDLI